MSSASSPSSSGTSLPVIVDSNHTDNTSSEYRGHAAIEHGALPSSISAEATESIRGISPSRQITSNTATHSPRSGKPILKHTASLEPPREKNALWMTSRPDEDKKEDSTNTAQSTQTSSASSGNVSVDKPHISRSNSLELPEGSHLWQTSRVVSKDEAVDAETHSHPQHRKGRLSAGTPHAEQIHLLPSWGQIKQKLRNKTLAVFLDYDGTLSPIVSVPSEAVLPDATRLLLSHVSSAYPTAIVSGRKIETIQNFVKINHSQLFYAGSHGFDIRSKNNNKIKDIAEEFLPLLNKFRDQCQAEIQSHNIAGATVEDNIYSITIHHRNVKDEKQEEELKNIIRKLLADVDKQLQMFDGKKCFEVRPRLDWHKGQAVNELLKVMFPNEQERQQVVPIYVGDDTTDEDAFHFLRYQYEKVHSHHHHHQDHHPTSDEEIKCLTVLVKAKFQSAHKLSHAQYQVENTEEVSQLLQRLIDLREE